MARRIRRLPRCQRRGCWEPVNRSVRIELPGSWLGVGLFDPPPAGLYVGLCRRCAREVVSRQRQLAEAHRRFGHAMAAIDAESEALRRNRELEQQLGEAEGALAYQRERAAQVVGAFGVLLNAYLRLLAYAGSGVADAGDALRDLGLLA